MHIDKTVCLVRLERAPDLLGNDGAQSVGDLFELGS
jgi:hypothetical protein